VGSRQFGHSQPPKVVAERANNHHRCHQPPTQPKTTIMTNMRTKRKADVVILIQKVMASVYSSALQQFSGLGRPKPESLRGRQNSKETLWYRRFFWSHLDISIKSSANRQEIYIHQIKSNIHL